MRVSDGPASSTTRRNRSNSSMPAWRVFVMPVSGAQQAWLHEMLQAAVHSMNMRDGSAPASSGRTAGVSSFFNGSFSGQSPQNLDPPALSSSRSLTMVGPVQTSWTDAVRTSPSTRWAYGSAQPHTIRPSQSMTRMSHGQEQRQRVARQFSDTRCNRGNRRSPDHPFFLASFFMYASSLSFSYFTVLRNRLSAR